MAKLSREDLIKKVSEKIEDSDLQIELMEDISDSFEEDSNSVSKEDFDKLTSDYNDLKEKYKSRFLEVKEEKEDKKEDKKEESESEEELEEKEVINIEEI